LNEMQMFILTFAIQSLQKSPLQPYATNMTLLIECPNCGQNCAYDDPTCPCCAQSWLN
jgi:hypothetical protein